MSKQEQVSLLLQQGYETTSWLQENAATLKEEYAEKFIAMQGTEVLAHAGTVDTLMRGLSRRNIDSAQVIVMFVSKTNILL